MAGASRPQREQDHDGGWAKHPSTYSTSELLTMCQSERLVLEQRALTLNRQLRERAAEPTTIEQRLETIHAPEECLRNDKAARQLRVVK